MENPEIDAGAVNFSRVLHDHLICRICTRGIKAGKSRWFQCVEQHYICQDCKTESIITCPCGQQMFNGHDPLIQELLRLKSMIFKCHSWRKGCKFQINGEEAMLSHEENCIFWKVQRSSRGL